MNPESSQVNKEDEKRALTDNVAEFLKAARREKSAKSYNSAVTLYFKAIAVLIDLYILGKEGYIPSNHTQRFRLLEVKYPKLYQILDKDFPLYQQSYRLKLGKDYAEVLENDFNETIQFTEIKIDSKKIPEKK